MMSVLDQSIEMLDQCTALELRGTVDQVRGLALHVADLPAPIGASVRIVTKRGKGVAIEGQVVGLRDHRAIVMPLADTTGVACGDIVKLVHPTQTAPVGDGLLGRVVNGMGKTIDGLTSPTNIMPRSIAPPPIDPLHRKLIDQPLATGIRAIDAMTPLGRGQRVGIFAQPGLGKSTLLGQIARHTAADVIVIALVGERGREVRDFLENTLGPEGLARSVVVCATSDEPALLRIRAAHTAAAVAEHFRDQGLDVLLLMDSITRFCQAQRQVGLAAGEPPATKGFPPSVFSMLPALLERAGRTNVGSITGLYAVLVEGDEVTDPIADACRGVLDGHVQLSRKLAEQGHYPAVDVLGSISRVADDVTSEEHRHHRTQVIKTLASYDKVEDLLNIGAYAPGSNPDFDLAIQCKPAINQLLQQGRGELKGQADFNATARQLAALNQHLAKAQQQLSARKPRAGAA